MLRKLVTIGVLAMLLSLSGGTVLSQDDEGGGDPGGGGGQGEGGGEEGGGDGGGGEDPPHLVPEPSTFVIWGVLAGTGAIAGLGRRWHATGRSESDSTSDAL